MLYLFGRLALSDSLAYHEDWGIDDYPVPADNSQLEEVDADAQALKIGRRLRCECQLLPADLAITGQPE